MGERGERAYTLFLEGYNCSQAVVAAFSDELGIPLETAVRLASPFGGGMGRLREVCGAFSGMMVVFGLLYGYDEPGHHEKKTALYKDVQALAAKFRKKNGALVCREILGLRAGASDPTPEVRTPEYYRTRPCPRIAAAAADLLQEYLDTHPRAT